jgi:hypothetical protein
MVFALGLITSFLFGMLLAWGIGMLWKWLRGRCAGRISTSVSVVRGETWHRSAGIRRRPREEGMRVDGGKTHE